MNPRSLIHRYLLGDTSEDEAKELDRLLADDPELRREFILAATVDTGLREVAFERAVEPRQPQAETKPTNRLRWIAWGSFIVAAVLIVAFRPLLSGNNSIAVLISSEDAAWESALPTTPGSTLAPGLLNLKAGVATVRFDSGAEIVLEAPAQLELVTAMRGKLLAGAAVIDVPERAIGFTIETPDGYAVDYGTQFAVRVDQLKKQSDFEIIEGEIAVHHPPSGDEVRLTGQGQGATVSTDSLVRFDSESPDREEIPSSNIVRIATNGRAASVRHDTSAKKPLNPEVLSVKRTNNGKRDHRCFFSFDLSAVAFDEVDSAMLRLNLVPSTRGFASRLPKINRFGVYGLTNPAKKDWQNDVTWDQAPGPDDGVLLGTFEIRRSQQRGSVGIEGEELLQFLKANHDGPVTLILVRETSQIQGFGPGLTHTFASDTHPEAVGPMLEFTIRD